MEYLNTKEALERLAEDFKLRLQRETNIEKLVASKDFVSKWDTRVTEEGIEIVNTSEHALAALEGNKRSNSRPPSSKKISRWMRFKRIRPYKRLKNGSTRFTQATEKAYNRAGFAIAKSIREKGSIKRFNYKPSRLIQEVYKQVEKRIGIELTEAVRDDLISEINRIIKTNQ